MARRAVAEVQEPEVQEPDVAEVASSIRLSVTRLARILRQQDGEGLTPSTGSALALLNRYGAMTLGELATREHVAAPTVTRIVEKLQAAGLVSRKVSERDGRVTYVEISEEGRRVMLDARSRRTQWLISHFEGLSPDDLEALGHAAPVLERLVDQAAREENG
jgi:DNA-binding MarR family transcriptional regulator